MSDIRFDDRVAIVTGAGGGLGRCHALELARRGAKVVINDLGGTLDGTGGNSEAAEAVVKEIEAMGGEAIANGSSVTDDAGVKKMIADAISGFNVTVYDGSEGGNSGLAQTKVFEVTVEAGNPKSQQLRNGYFIQVQSRVAPRG